MTCVVEFSGNHDRAFMEEQVKSLPGNLTPLAHNQEPNSYVVQQPDTRQRVKALQDYLEPDSFYLAGRFAEWEYHNMDKAIEASMAIAAKIRLN
jgi:UDP-galactopyranose mutase